MDGLSLMQHQICMINSHESKLRAKGQQGASWGHVGVCKLRVMESWGFWWWGQGAKSGGASHDLKRKVIKKNLSTVGMSRQPRGSRYREVGDGV